MRLPAQLRRLDNFHTFKLFTNEPTERLCALVAGLAPITDARVFLTCSGSEAVDSVQRSGCSPSEATRSRL